MSEPITPVLPETVFTEVATLMGRVFGVDPRKIQGSTTQNDIPRWDSLGMLTVLIGIERRLRVSISPEELDGIDNVDGIVGLVIAHQTTPM